MKIYIANAFSLSMLDRDQQSGNPAHANVRGFARIPRPVDDPADWLMERDDACAVIDEPFEVISAIGHQDTARILSGILDRDLPVNRVSIKLEPGTHLLVGQYVGPRLPEGATALPEGARIEWWSV